MPVLSNAPTLDYQAIERTIKRRARAGLETALDELEARAKKHAPVRNVFGSSVSNKRQERVPRGIQRRKQKDGTTKVFGRKIRHHSAKRQDAFLKQVRGQQPRRQRLEFGGRRIEGNSRSMQPVVRDSQSRRLSGKLRSVDIQGGKAAYRPVTVDIEGVRGTRVRKGSEFLNRYGRMETARANRTLALAKRANLSDKRIANMIRSASFRQDDEERIKRGGFTDAQKAIRKTGLYASESGEITMGGRLRDEIYVGPIVETGSSLYGEVISPTEYAKYQEYGTSNHRAQPFMRPALYEMRNRFRMHIVRAMRRRGI